MQLIDTDLAHSTAQKLLDPGPRLTKMAVREEVRGLRQAADFSVAPVMELSGLDGTHGPAVELADSEVLVVDRPTWVKANLTTVPLLLEDARSAMAEKLTPGMMTAASKAYALQIGTVLSFLATRVMGQFDPYTALKDPATGQPVGPTCGRLMLVAPNMAAIRTEMNVRSTDFRRWVCLHETTHRLQFNAAPWLNDHMQASISELLQLIYGSAAAATGAEADEKTPAPSKQRVKELLSPLTGVMSLLEGHANHVMDSVGRDLVPTVKEIRRKFEKRAENDSLFVTLIKKLLKFDLKAAQYRDGQKFVAAVVKEIGLTGFNEVWNGPEFLPTEAEIHAPLQWIERIRALG